MNALLSHYRDVRSRLWNPPNARDDLGIDLKRKAAAPRPDPEPLPPMKMVPQLLPDNWRDHVNALDLECEDEPEPDPGRVMILDCVRAVANVFVVSFEQILGPRRYQDLVLPRQVAMALAYRLTGKSFPGIGRAMGGRDHTTILHAIRRRGHLVDAVAAELGDSRDPVAWAQAILALPPAILNSVGDYNHEK